jgi:hypothetical protein
MLIIEEPAFADGEGRRIDIPQSAFTHRISAEASVLGNISQRILVKCSLVGLGD